MKYLSSAASPNEIPDSGSGSVSAPASESAAADDDVDEEFRPESISLHSTDMGAADDLVYDDQGLPTEPIVADAVAEYSEDLTEHVAALPIHAAVKVIFDTVFYACSLMRKQITEWISKFI